MAVKSAVSALVHEVEQLDNRSLDAFIANVLSLRVQREMPEKQKKEVALLKKINKSLSIKQIERFRELNTKRLETGISEAENVELLVLLDKIEKLNVTRLKYLTALAQLRNVSVRELMQQLGITPSVNG
jgi:hypothetical protein